MTDEANARAALRRALEEQSQRMPHAPMALGREGRLDGVGYFLQVLVMRPCKCGAAIAHAMFVGGDAMAAIRHARAFVEAVTPPEESQRE